MGTDGTEQTVLLEGDITILTGEVESPTVRTRMFNSLQSALDYCSFVKPEEHTIKRVGETVWQLNYMGSEGTA